MRTVVVIACIAGIVSAAVAKPKYQPVNVDVAGGWDGLFRPECWTPIEITIYPQTKTAFHALLSLECQQDEMTDAKIFRPIDITPGVPLRVPLGVKLAYGAAEYRLKIIDDRGHMCWSSELHIFPPGLQAGYEGRLCALEGDELLIGFAGRMAAGIKRLGERTRTEKNKPVHIAYKPIDRLPIEWTGYCGLDVLVLNDPDFNRLDERTSGAIIQWVRRGGRLLIVLGGRALPADHPIGRLLPFAVQTPRQVTLTAKMLRRWKCDPAKETQISSWLNAPPTHGPLWWCDDPAGVFACGMKGFGYVGVLGFSPGIIARQDGANVAGVWAHYLNRLAPPDRRLDVVSPDNHLPVSNPEPHHDWRYRPSDRYVNQILNRLLSIPQLEPLGVWPVAIVLGVLAVWVGPLEYLVLKRLRRRHWTWVTAPIWIVAATAAAYYGVEALRGGRMQVRAVSVADYVAGEPAGCRTTYAGIFAPRSDAYRLTGLRSDQWWSAISPTDETNLWRYRSQQVATRQLDYVQHAGGNLPGKVPIKIWSMQCLLVESPQADAPLTARATRAGDKLEIRIRNVSAAPIRCGFVYGRDCRGDGGKFGRIGPGEEVCVTIPTAAKGAWQSAPPETVAMTCGWGTPAMTGPCSMRTKAMENYINRGAVVVLASCDDAPLDFGVVDRRYDTDHTQLIRLVVFPEEVNDE